MEHTSQERTNRPRWTRFAVVAGSVCMTGALLAGGLIKTRQNSEYADELRAVAAQLAASRNTCSLKEVKLVRTEGQSMLNIVVELAPKDDPAVFSREYDRLGMDATFTDLTGDLVSGVEVVNTSMVQANENPLYTRVLVGDPDDSPSMRTNQVKVGPGFFSKNKSIYEVFRRNAIKVDYDRPLVGDGWHALQGTVPCGSFSYAPGTSPHIQ